MKAARHAVSMLGFPHTLFKDSGLPRVLIRWAKAKHELPICALINVVFFFGDLEL